VTGFTPHIHVLRPCGPALRAVQFCSRQNCEPATSTSRT